MVATHSALVFIALCGAGFAAPAPGPKQLHRYVMLDEVADVPDQMYRDHHYAILDNEKHADQMYRDHHYAIPDTEKGPNQMYRDHHYGIRDAERHADQMYRDHHYAISDAERHAIQMYIPGGFWVSDDEKAPFRRDETTEKRAGADNRE